MCQLSIYEGCCYSDTILYQNGTKILKHYFWIRNLNINTILMPCKCFYIYIIGGVSIIINTTTTCSNTRKNLEKHIPGFYIKLLRVKITIFELWHKHDQVMKTTRTLAAFHLKATTCPACFFCYFFFLSTNHYLPFLLVLLSVSCISSDYSISSMKAGIFICF